MKYKCVFVFSIILCGALLREAAAQTFLPTEAQPAIIYEEGTKLLRDQQYTEAARKFETVIRLEPANAEAYNALGAVYVYCPHRGGLKPSPSGEGFSRFSAPC